MDQKVTTIARELGYEKVMPDIIERLKSAKSDAERNRIMITARNRMYK